jgi:hypothetical protein
MRGALAVCCCLVGASSLTGCDLAFGLEPKSYDFVFDNAASQTDLVDVPVLITLDRATFAYGAVDDPATDLRFADPSTGAELPYEVSRWDPEGSSDVWVGVPRIAQGSTTDHIVLTPGPNIGTGGAIPSEAWRTHELVLHLEQNDQIPDASGHYVGVPVPATLAEGAVGTGFELADGVGVEIPDGKALFNRWNRFTFELWIHPNFATISTASPQPNLFYRPGPIARCGVRVSATKRLELALELSISGTTKTLATEIPTLAWSYVVFVADGQRLSVYKDGVLVDSVANTAALAATDVNSEFFGIGGERFDGIVDEIRLSAAERSPDWIRAQYRSMTRTFLRAE